MFVKCSSTYQWFRGTASLLLLFGYFLNVVSFQGLHQVVHDHDHSELHTPEAEADSCHRAIYHGDTSHDCEHKSHITETITDCDLCKVTVSRFHFNSDVVKAVEKPSQITFTKPASTKFFGYDFSLAYAPRGPPTFS
ncbi:MAG: hypothetical protein K9G41_09235 [Flavobacteriales bacterium]|nr:hypothetical protein [Flavobacteriales bacterium]